MHGATMKKKTFYVWYVKLGFVLGWGITYCFWYLVSECRGKYLIQKEINEVWAFWIAT